MIYSGNFTELSDRLYTLWAVYSSDGRVSTLLRHRDCPTTLRIWSRQYCCSVVHVVFLKDSNKFICLSQTQQYFIS